MGSLFSFSRQQQTKKLVTLNIGDLVEVIIVSIIQDRIIVEYQTIQGFVLKIHLHDDSYLGSMMLENIKIGQKFIALVIAIDDNGVEFTFKKTLHKFKTMIPFYSQEMKANSSYYGYIKSHTSRGALVGFYGSAIGLLRGYSIPVGSCVYVEVEVAGSVPDLKLLTSMHLEYTVPLEFSQEISSFNPFHEIGTVITIHSEPCVCTNNRFEYFIENEWKAIVLSRRIEDISKVVVRFVDSVSKRIFCLPYRPAIGRTLCTRCTIVELIGDIALVTNYIHLYVCKKPFYPVNVGDIVYISKRVVIGDSNDLNIIREYTTGANYDIGLIEPSKLQYDEKNILCSIDRIYEEWCICSSSNNIYLLHKTQLQNDVQLGQFIEGKCIHLKGFDMLIIDTNLPLYLEDCTNKMSVVCIALDLKAPEQHGIMRISPFIIGYIKEKISWLYKMHNACLKCTISKIRANSVDCILESKVYTANILDVAPGLYFIVEIPESEHTSLMKLDFTDIVGLNINIGDQLDVYKLNNEYVSPKVPFYNQITDCKECLPSGFVFRNDDKYIYVHLRRNINVRIPNDYACDSFENIDAIKPPEPGMMITGTFMPSNDGTLLMSARNYDRNHRPIKAKKNQIYRAAIISVDDEKLMLYVDVMDKYVNVAYSEVIPAELNFVYIVCTQVCPEMYDIVLMRDSIPFINNSIDKITCNSHLQCRLSDFNDDFSPVIPDDDYTYDKSSEHINDDNENATCETSTYNSTACSSDSESTESNEKLHVENTSKTHVKKNKHVNPKIRDLRQVYLKRHVSKTNINHKRLQLLLDYLRSHDNIPNWCELARKVHLDPETIKDWHVKCHDDPHWSPLNVKSVPTHKAMMDILEGGIIWYIYKKYLSKGYQFNDQMCRTIALAFWKKYKQYRIARRFTASNRWIKRFKEKYGLVNRRVHYHRRSIVTPNGEAYARKFLKDMSDIYEKHKNEGTLHLLVNIDETNWRVGNFGDLTWASRGTDHVEFHSSFNDKECITAVAAITASPDLYKLPLCIIKAGDTDKAKKIFNELKEYFQIEISESGWSTTKCFANYLVWLRKELDERFKNIPGYTQTTNIDLVLDLFASHRNKKVKELANMLHFTVHFIPAGLTDAFQPLDRYVFGNLKTIARTEWYKAYILNPNRKFSLLDACAILIKCWAEISDTTIKKSWLPYSNPGEQDIDSMINATSIKVTIEESQLTIDEDEIREEMNDINAIDLLRGNKEESDSEEDIDYSLLPMSSYNDIRMIQNMQTIVSHENYLKERFSKPYFIKPIANTEGICFANTFIQLLSIIPGMREQLSMNARQSNEDSFSSVLKNCLDQYDRESDIVQEFDLRLYEYITEDVSENVANILSTVQSFYGLKIQGCQNRIYTIPLVPTEDIINIEESIDDYIQGNEYELDKLMFFEKAVNIRYEFPEVFEYDKYLFILKAAVTNITNTHFYLYIRNHFTKEYILVNDEVIKEADIYDINEDNICLAMYYIFEKEEKRDNEKETIVTNEIDITQDINKILKEIYIASLKTKEEKEVAAEEQYNLVCIPAARKFPECHGKIVNNVTPFVKLCAGKTLPKK